MRGGSEFTRIDRHGAAKGLTISTDRHVGRRKGPQQVVRSHDLTHSNIRQGFQLTTAVKVALTLLEDTDRLLFSSSGELFLALPTSVLTSKAAISSAGKGRIRLIGAGWAGVTVKPAFEVSGVKDDRHAVVDRQPLSVRGVVPCVPQASKGHHLPVGEVEGEGLVVLRIKTLPFVEAGGGDEAAAFLEGLAVGARGGDRLGAGVEGRRRMMLKNVRFVGFTDVLGTGQHR